MRWLVAVTVAASMVAGAPTFTTAHAAHHNGNRKTVECRTSDGNGWSDRDVRQGIKCAVGHFSVKGGKSKALSVAKCESHFDEHNYFAGHYGVYQFLRSTFNSAISHMHTLVRRFDLKKRIYNARTNILVAIKLAHHSWRPWSCA